MRHIIKTLAVISTAALIGIAACGDDDEDDNNNNSGTVNNDNGSGGGNTNNDNDNDNTGSGSGSLQQQAFDNNQIGLADASSITLDADTLAVSGISPASPATDLPAGFEANDYYGAVDPDPAATPFWQGWTVIDSGIDGGLPGDDFHPLMAEIMDGTITPASDNGCAGFGFANGGTVTVFGAEFPVCVIEDDIESDITLVNDHVFVLAETINIGNGDAAELMPVDSSGNPVALLDVTLTIPPGTQIYAIEGSSSGSDTTFTAVGAALVATRGSAVNVNGTSALPVIMAAVEADLSLTGSGDVIVGDPTDLTGRGDWGGLVLSGLGVTNRADANNESETEAAPADSPRSFGGTDNADSSGSVTYVVIAETGFAFREDEEVQGLTIEAAGSGTTIDYVQIIQSADDCIEWFGGAANASHLVCNGVSDDGLDIDTGYVGRIQYALIRIGSSEGARGIESDSGSSSNFDLEPRSAPVMANVTVLGNAGAGLEADDTIGALHREGISPEVWRSVYTDDTAAGGTFEAGCLDVDNQLQPGLAYVDAVFNCTGGDAIGLVEDSE